MSARAAARLRTLGFEQIFRYTAGKMDWFASGLPREGKLAARRRLGDLARRDVPTCECRERVGAVARRTRAAGWDVCVVIDAERAVLGLLDAVALDGDAAALAEEAMREGPTTLRPHGAVEDSAERLKRRDSDHVLITTSDGRLVGGLRRSDVARRIAGTRERAEALTR